MRPIKAISLVKKVSDKCEYKEEDIKKVIEYFYKKATIKLSNMEYPSVKLDFLGKFYIKERFMNKQEKIYTGMLESMQKHFNSNRKEIIIREIQKRLGEIKGIKEFLRLRLKRREEFKLIKQEYYDTKNKKDLEG